MAHAAALFFGPSLIGSVLRDISALKGRQLASARLTAFLTAELRELFCWRVLVVENERVLSLAGRDIDDKLRQFGRITGGLGCLRPLPEGSPVGGLSLWRRSSGATAP